MTANLRRLGIVTVLLFVSTALVRASDKTAQPASLPSIVNLRPEFQRLRLEAPQQGRRGSCQVFAMVGVIEFEQARRSRRVDLSEQFLMWAANRANGIDRTEGFNPDLLIAGLKQYGICEESLLPYIPRNEALGEPSAEAIRDAQTRTSCRVVSIKHWSSDIGYEDKHIREILRRLVDGTPVTATLCWPTGLNDQQIVDGQNFLLDKSVDESKNGHGVILVGYRLDETLAGGGYFIFRNSWGPQFADRGYAQVTFEYVRKYGIDAYSVSLR